MLGGAALVGAAAAYAALAFRFRNFNAAEQAGQAFGKSSPEFRAAQAFSKEYLRQEERARTSAFSGGASSHDTSSHERDEQHQQHRSNYEQRKQRVQEERFRGAAPEWALRELGLDAMPSSFSDAKVAYRRRAKVVHPDAAGSDDAAFKRLQEAWAAVEPHARERG